MNRHLPATPSLLIIGECLIEFSPLEYPLYKQAFAGDTFNTAVYAKRWEPSLAVSYMTAIGYDAKSAEFLTLLDEENIHTDRIVRVQDKTLGTYMISLDEQGERTFLYWRNDSAARSMLKTGNLNNEFADIYDAFYLSGITVAILDEADREVLLSFLKEMQARGKIIAFDPNYRPALWSSVAQARHWLALFYFVSSIALPGMDDHAMLFDHKTPQEVSEFLSASGVKEQVIKASKEGVYCFRHGTIVHHQPFRAADAQLDATAAGDSFAGVYLAQRLSGLSMAEATHSACEMARYVVTQKGAIVESSLYQNFVQHLRQQP